MDRMKQWAFAYFRRKHLIIDWIDTLAIWALMSLVIASLFFQFTLNELPCPLCLLQRLGLLLTAISLTWIINFGRHSRHYGLTLLAALFTGLVATRQVLLHIVPGTGSYGEPFLGLSLYLWTDIVVLCIMLYVVAMLILGIDNKRRLHPSLLGKVTAWVLFIVILITTAMVIVECGFANCPDSPTTYKLIDFFT